MFQPPLELGSVAFETRGAVAPLVGDRQYAIVQAGMVGANSAADLALHVERAGGHPTSESDLRLPAPSGTPDTFVAAMTEPLDCLLRTPTAGEPVALAISSDIDLPIGVFLIDGSDVAVTFAACGIVP